MSVRNYRLRLSRWCDKLYQEEKDDVQLYDDDDDSVILINTENNDAINMIKQEPTEDLSPKNSISTPKRFVRSISDYVGHYGSDCDNRN